MTEKYIKASECEKYFYEHLDDLHMKAAMNAIDEMPNEDVAPVRHGLWVDEYDCGYTTPHCSECGETALTKEETSYDYVYSSYCPHCGAKMDEKECDSK